MKFISFLWITVAALALCALLTPTVHAADKKDSMLRHVVAFKFKASASPEGIKKVEEAFRDLKKKIPQIAHLEWGINNSPENLNKGFTHGFILSFKSEEDRSAYLPHPDHKAFGALLGPLIEDVFVIDFWAKE